jgi:ribonucleoside-diphosphate reductase alpha chain
MRNATVTTIAPTGTISIIASCSQGIEPLFAIVYIREVAESLGRSLIEVNPLFESIALKEGFYSEELMKKIARRTSIQEVKEIPESVRRLFVVAHDISAEWHIQMQAAFQKHTDNAVSKTINFPNNATPDDIEKTYRLAYKLGCKGVTVYRHGSREKQVLRPLESNGTLGNLNLECLHCS